MYFLFKIFFKKHMVMYRVLIHLFSILIKIIQITRKSKSELIIEKLSLRQQLATYQSEKIKPKLSDLDRSFWITLKQAWSKWMDSLVIVKPATVINWQNRRFRKYWTKISTKTKRRAEKESTTNFSILFVFFIIDHSRRKIINFNVTSQPCAVTCL